MKLFAALLTFGMTTTSALNPSDSWPHQEVSDFMNMPTEEVERHLERYLESDPNNDYYYLPVSTECFYDQVEILGNNSTIYTPENAQRFIICGADPGAATSTCTFLGKESDFETHFEQPCEEADGRVVFANTDYDDVCLTVFRAKYDFAPWDWINTPRCLANSCSNEEALSIYKFFEAWSTAGFCIPCVTEGRNPFISSGSLKSARKQMKMRRSVRAPTSKSKKGVDGWH